MTEEDRHLAIALAFLTIIIGCMCLRSYTESRAQHHLGSHPTREEMPDD